VKEQCLQDSELRKEYTAIKGQGVTSRRAEFRKKWAEKEYKTFSETFGDTIHTITSQSVGGRTKKSCLFKQKLKDVKPSLIQNQMRRHLVVS
jgi:hypothetical protein